MLRGQTPGHFVNGNSRNAQFSRIDRAAGFERSPPGEHQLVGPEVGVVVIVPAAGQPGLERRLERDKRIAVASPRRAVKRLGHQAVGRGVGIHFLLRPVGEQQPARFKFAVERFALDQLAIERQRREQSGWMPRPAAIMSRSLQRAAKCSSHDQRAGSNRGLIANGELRRTGS